MHYYQRYCNQQKNSLYLQIIDEAREWMHQNKDYCNAHMSITTPQTSLFVSLLRIPSQQVPFTMGQKSPPRDSRFAIASIFTA
jgi:hypothetical protein